MKDNQTYLVVDDDDVFRTRLSKALEGRNLHVHSAPSIDHALELLNNHTPQRIILDLKLPNKSGVEGAKLFLKQLPDVKIVILTGYGSVSTAVDCINLGCVNYITKPTDVDSIIAAFNGSSSSASSKQISKDLELPSLAQVEWDYIQRVLKDNNGNISQSAKALGIHRRSLQRKLARD